MTKNNKLWLLAAAAIVLVPAALYSVQVLGYQDLQIISAPSNPPSGFLRFSAQTGALGCLTSGGANCLSGLAPGGAAGGDLSGTYPNPTVAKINGASVPTNCALTTSNGSSQLACQTAKGLASVAYVAGGGTANAQTVTYSPAVAALADIVGYPICWLPSNANSTTTPTLAVNGLTAHTIVKAGGAVAANDLLTTTVACVIWDATSFELQNPQTNTGGSASPLTTKGDLYTFSTVNARLAVGSDGQCLTAQSGQTTGLQWAACTAGGGGGMTQIAQNVVVGTSTSSVTLSGIPGSYSQLLLYVQGRTSDTNPNQNVNMTFNADSTAGHYNEQFTVGHTSATAGVSNSAIPAFTIAGDTAVANNSGIAIIDIPGYANASFLKLFYMRMHFPFNTLFSDYEMAITVGGWNSTSAVTSITLADSGAGHFVAGTTFTLYGVQ